MRKTLQKILLGISLAIIPLSCKNLTGLEEFDIPEIQYRTQDINGVLDYVARNIDCASDKKLYGYTDYWANPEETYNNQRGDCEDRVILNLYLLKRDFGIEGKMVLGECKYVEKNGGHAWLEINGKWYDTIYHEFDEYNEPCDSFENDFPNYEFVKSYSYNQAMRRTGVRIK